jgi:hypothetical protein
MFYRLQSIPIWSTHCALPSWPCRFDRKAAHISLPPDIAALVDQRRSDRNDDGEYGDLDPSSWGIHDLLRQRG